MPKCGDSFSRNEGRFTYPRFLDDHAISPSDSKIIANVHLFLLAIYVNKDCAHELEIKTLVDFTSHGTSYYSYSLLVFVCKFQLPFDKLSRYAAISIFWMRAKYGQIDFLFLINIVIVLFSCLMEIHFAFSNFPTNEKYSVQGLQDVLY